MAYFQQNMLSIRSRQLLANLFAEILVISEETESFKVILASIPGFDAIQLFRSLDRDQKGFLLERDLQFLIGSTHRKLVTYAYSWLDRLKLGEVTKFEFKAFLTPKHNPELATLMNMVPQEMSALQNIISQINVFVEMILRIVSGEMRLIQIRRELLASHDYSFQAVKLCLTSDKYVNANSIFILLQNYGISCNLQQINNAIEYVGQQGVLSFQQLQWLVEGLEKGKQYLSIIKRTHKTSPQRSKIRCQQKSNKKNIETTLSPSLINKNQNNVFRQIINKYKECQQKYQLVDKMLIETQKKIIYQNENEYKARLQLIKRKQHQEDERMMHHYKNLQMQAQIDRILFREAASLHPPSINQSEYSFLRQKESPPLRQRLHSSSYDYPSQYIQNSHPIAAEIRRKYANLSNLNSLTEVQSQRKSLESSNISAHLKTSEISLAESKRLREKIKQQRNQSILSKIPQFGTPDRQDRITAKQETKSTNKMWS